MYKRPFIFALVLFGINQVALSYETCPETVTCTDTIAASCRLGGKWGVDQSSIIPIKKGTYQFAGAVDGNFNGDSIACQYTDPNSHTYSGFQIMPKIYQFHAAIHSPNNGWVRNLSRGRYTYLCGINIGESRTSSECAFNLKIR